MELKLWSLLASTFASKPSLQPSLFFWNRSISQADLKLHGEDNLELWSFYLHLPSAGTAGMCHNPTWTDF